MLLSEDIENNLFHVADHRIALSFISQWMLSVIFWECRESEDTHEKSNFLLFRQNIPLGELIQGKIARLLNYYIRATFWERRESEDTHEKSIFLLFRQNIPLGELI